MKALLALAVCLLGCTTTGNGPVWTGMISRDGKAVEFIGYDPSPSQGQQFGASPEAVGYIDVDGLPVLVEMSLEIVNIQRVPILSKIPLFGKRLSG